MKVIPKHSGDVKDAKSLKESLVINMYTVCLTGILNTTLYFHHLLSFTASSTEVVWYDNVNDYNCLEGNFIKAKAVFK